MGINLSFFLYHVYTGQKGLGIHIIFFYLDIVTINARQITTDNYVFVQLPDIIKLIGKLFKTNSISLWEQ